MRGPILALLLLALTASAQDAAPVRTDGAPRQAAPAPRAPEPAVQERLAVRRLYDTVAVRTGSPAAGRVLYAFAPSAELGPGDVLEQGSSGISEILLPGGGLVTLRASAHVEVEAVGPETDDLWLPLVTRADARAGARPLRLHLPGGVRCTLEGTGIVLTAESGRLHVRNSGSAPVVFEGAFTAEAWASQAAERSDEPGRLVLGVGEETAISLPGSTTGPETAQQLWGALAVRSTGLLLSSDEDGLLLTSEAHELAGEAVVGGVRAFVPPGGRLRLRQARPLAEQEGGP